jgi:hypothetical protein
MLSENLNPAEHRLSPLAVARGWAVEQDRKFDEGLWRGEWRSRARAQAFINNRRAA